MTTKKVTLYVEGWICSGCKADVDTNTEKCPKCGKAFEDTKDSAYDEEREVEFPAEWEICEDCRGKGTTYLGWAARDQPAFTAEDMAYEGPDFMEDYMTGAYDSQCPECNGSGKVKVIDSKAVESNPELNKLYKAYIESVEQDAYYDAISRAERAMGA